MPTATLPDLRIALTFLRLGQGWRQADLAEAAGISPKLLNDYERGRKNLTRDRLAHIIAFMGLPPEAIDSTLATLAANRASGRAPEDSSGSGSPASRQVEAAAVRFGNTMTGFARAVALAAHAGRGGYPCPPARRPPLGPPEAAHASGKAGPGQERGQIPHLGAL